MLRSDNCAIGALPNLLNQDVVIAYRVLLLEGGLCSTIIMGFADIFVDLFLGFDLLLTLDGFLIISFTF